MKENAIQFDVLNVRLFHHNTEQFFQALLDTEILAVTLHPMLLTTTQRKILRWV